MEAVLAVAVLAAVLPWVMLAVAQSLDTGAEVRVEQVAMRVVPACLDEWSRGDRLPSVYAIGMEGQVLGVVDPDSDARGVAEWNGRRLLALCRVGFSGELVRPGAGSLQRVSVGLDYPACAAARHRRHLVFHTLRS